MASDLLTRALEACERLARARAISSPGDLSHECWLIGREVIEAKAREAEPYYVSGVRILRRFGTPGGAILETKTPEQASAVCKALNDTEPK